MRVWNTRNARGRENLPNVRQPAVAGTFYPADPVELAGTIRDFLEKARIHRPVDAPRPKAVIAPHAGYVYSGPIAASAFVHLELANEGIERVVLLGPAQRFAIRGLAASSADAFATPLGQVPIDREALELALSLDCVAVENLAHSNEHCLEVHLPFLQLVLGDFSILPLVVGDARPEDVRAVLDLLWGGPETFILVSSDLSHYHDYNTALRMDRDTTLAIEALRPTDIDYEQACGRIPVQGLMLAALERKLGIRAVDVRNSGDTAGGRDSVVGYGSYVLV
jgi:AmmeMemoRadiSam system protein B